MNINWDEMDEKMETGFEQQAADLQEMAESSEGFLFPEDFEERTANRVKEGEKALERVKLLEKAICIYCRENIDEEFDGDKAAIKYFEHWAGMNT